MRTARPIATSGTLLLLMGMIGCDRSVPEGDSIWGAPGTITHTVARPSIWSPEQPFAILPDHPADLAHDSQMTDALVRMIDSAEFSVVLSRASWPEPKIGEALLRAAKRTVEVHLLGITESDASPAALQWQAAGVRLEQEPVTRPSLLVIDAHLVMLMTPADPTGEWTSPKAMISIQHRPFAGSILAQLGIAMTNDVPNAESAMKIQGGFCSTRRMRVMLGDFLAEAKQTIHGQFDAIDAPHTQRVLDASARRGVQIDLLTHATAFPSPTLAVEMASQPAGFTFVVVDESSALLFTDAGARDADETQCCFWMKSDSTAVLDVLARQHARSFRQSAAGQSHRLQEAWR